MRVFLTLAILMLWIPFGCSSTNKQQSLSKDSNLSNVSSDTYLYAARTVLRHMQFHINKFDLDNKYLMTAPLSGAQLIEFWRSDNAGLFNTAEANIQSITRRVEVVYPDQASGPQIIVTTKRLSLDTDEPVSLADARNIFTRSQGRNQGIAANMDFNKTRWIDLGRDKKLEEKIARLINQEIAD